jgi:hypothetical protein
MRLMRGPGDDITVDVTLAAHGLQVLAGFWMILPGRVVIRPDNSPASSRAATTDALRSHILSKL